MTYRERDGFFVGGFILAMAFILTAGFAAVGTGCGAPPVERSQTVLIETAQALSHVDHAAAKAARQVRDGALERVRERAASECPSLVPGEGETTDQAAERRQDCFAELLRDEMSGWFDLLDALSSAHDFLEVWEAANDGWRSSGEQPPDWDARICRPLRETVEAVIGLLEAVEIEVPEPWRAILLRADVVCSISVQLATRGES